VSEFEADFPNKRCRFRFGSGIMDYIEVVRTDSGLTIRGGDLLRIYPRASNMLFVEIVDPNSTALKD